MQEEFSLKDVSVQDVMQGDMLQSPFSIFNVI